LTAANRGTALITSALVKKILKRNADPTISDTEKTTRKMSEYFTSAGMPISNASVHAIYVNNNLYPARETYELDLRQHHHRRLRVHLARKKRRMTQEDWEAWVSSDETIIYMQKPRNARNNVKWVPKGTVRPNARATDTLDQLEKATKKAWKSITPAEILAIQHSVPKRMKAVIESEGWPIDY
jgi:hypothetical protein